MAKPEGPLAHPIAERAQDPPAPQGPPAPPASQAPNVPQASQVLQQLYLICHH